MSGGRRRELELIRRLARDWRVHLLVITKTLDEDLRHAAEMEDHGVTVELHGAEPEQKSSDPRHVARHRCSAATHRVADLVAAGAVDLIHVEGYYLMQHVPDWVRTPLLLVEQNVEYELERQHALAVGTTIDLLGLASASRTRRAEQHAWRRATALGTVTEEDRNTVLGVLPRASVRVIPDGSDHISAVLGESPGESSGESPGGISGGPPRVTLVANFAYAPNVDAAMHFCAEILPRIRKRVPQVSVQLVGNAPPAEVSALASATVTVTGRVPDVAPHFDAADVVVCPLRIGGGIKVKAIEALRRGKPMVSTSIGTQGLPAAARHAIRIADEPQAFADATSTLLLDDVGRTALARAARRAARELPRWDDGAAELATAYRSLLRRGDASGEDEPLRVGVPA